MKVKFSELGLPVPMVSLLASRSKTEAFPVQAAAIPDALAGRDISAQAPTGSGKTLAFGLPLLASVSRARPLRPRALILAPTRELAEQIKEELVPLARVMDRQVSAIYGGVGYGPQTGALRRGVDVLVATPGRLEDLTASGNVALDEVEVVVIDEADRMADMGFLPAVRRLLGATSRHRQTMLFSATLDGDVAVLSRQYQRNPIRHEVASNKAKPELSTHQFWLVNQERRVDHAAELIRSSDRTLVFTRTRHRADRLVKHLTQLGISAVALHGGRSQQQRSKSLTAFSTGRAQALVATNVAARGLHIEAVGTVVHFDVAADAKDYLHRSGRTARAGAGGSVVTLLTVEERRDVLGVQRELNMNEPIVEPPGKPMPRAPQREASQPGPNRAVYIGNIPWRTTAPQLQALVDQYGEVQQTTIATDHKGRSKGFGLVDMSEPAALAAIRGLHGSTFAGRSLTVRFARPQPASV